MLQTLLAHYRQLDAVVAAACYCSGALLVVGAMALFALAISEARQDARSPV